MLWAQPMQSQCVLTMSGVKALDFALYLPHHNFSPPSFLLQSCSAACLVLALNRRWGNMCLWSSKLLGRDDLSVCLENGANSTLAPHQHQTKADNAHLLPHLPSIHWFLPAIEKEAEEQVLIFLKAWNYSLQILQRMLIICSIKYPF